MSFIVRSIMNCGGPHAHETCEYYAQLPTSSSSPLVQLVPIHRVPPKQNPHAVRCVIVSDTHELHDRICLPMGDVLIHAGDILMADRLSLPIVSRHRMKKFFAWLNRQPHAAKIVIAGNHDHEFQKLGAAAIKKMAAPALYGEHEVVDVSVAVGGGSVAVVEKQIRFFATPWSQANSHRSPNKSFQQASWAIPAVPAAAVAGDVDVLLCHQGAWCPGLEELIRSVQPTVCHIGGHVHEAHGVTTINGLPSINGASIDGIFGKERFHRTIVVDLLLG